MCGGVRGAVRPVNWGRLVQMGKKVVSSIGKRLNFGSVVKVRIRQVVVMVRVGVSLQKMNVCPSKVPRNDLGQLVCVYQENVGP